MAVEKIVSAGVYTSENDKTFVAPGVGETGIAVIGPTTDGPAFVPVQIRSSDEYDLIFGGNNDYSYTAQTVKNYLKNNGLVNVVRVLNTEGIPVANANSYVVYVSGSNATGSDGKQVGVVLAPTIINSGSLLATSLTVVGTNSSFIIKSGSVGVSASFLTSSPNYVAKVFGSSPTSTNGNDISKNFYCYKLFSNNSNIFALASGSVEVTGSNESNGFSFVVNKNYSYASTPYITSQNSVSGGPYNLFKFATISDGDYANKKVKVVISDVKKPASGSLDYGTFNVVVRDFADTNNQPVVLETFSGCTLDPNSENYICNKIGTQYTTFQPSTGKKIINGDYPNKSSFIRVIPSDNLNSIPNEIVPFGHSSYLTPTGINNVSAYYPKLAFTQYQGNSTTYNSRIPFGLDFTNTDNLEYCSSISDSGSAVLNISGSFNLDNLFGHASSSLFSGSLSSSLAPTEMLKFAVGFQGGFDGIAYNKPKFVGENIVNTNVFGFDCSTATSAGTIAYKYALNAVSNEDEYDINMLILPGILNNKHPYVTDYASNLRSDVFYPMDCCGLNDAIQDAVDSVSGIDNNSVATYYPWVKIFDNITRKYTWVPPSVVISGVISFNDRISASWYAPAGLNRGGVPEATDIRTRLTQKERDTLYENRINPIAIFANQGISVYGQKNLQKRVSLVNRINVKRLLLTLRKYIGNIARLLVFEQNNSALRNQFLSLVNPYLETVKNRSGLSGFKVVMDETNNTPDVIDRNELIGAIYIIPVPSAEIIKLDFNISPTGTTFSE